MPGNKYLHLVYIPFLGVGISHKEKSREWLEYRMKIFNEYTLRSLKNQTNQNFLLWVSDTLIYWDDKFPTSFGAKLYNLARIIRNNLFRERTFKNLFSNLKESLKNKNKYLKEKLEKLLPQFKNIEADWIYLTRIDSDDMFHKEAIAEIQRQKPAYKKALIFDKGYVYNKNTGQLAEWLPKTNPPFHTIIFPKEVFCDPEKYLEYMDGFKSHEDIPKIFNCTKLSDWKYCVLIHDPRKQISTIWNHPFRGKEIIENKEEILKDFGI